MNLRNTTAPVLVENPYTGQMLNVEPLFELMSRQTLTMTKDGSELAEYVEKTIRFINEETLFTGHDGEALREIMTQLYQLKDCFRSVKAIEGVLQIRQPYERQLNQAA